MSGLDSAFNKIAQKFGQTASKRYSDVCDVKRNQAANGAQALNAIHEGVPCSSPKPSGGGKGGDAIRSKTTYVIEMPALINGTTLNTTKAQDVLALRATGLHPARDYKVQAVWLEQRHTVFARCTIEQ